MKAEELVGKCIEVDLAAVAVGQSGNAVLKVVGYNADVDWLIADAGNRGWYGIGQGDLIAEKCETYWYVGRVNIIKVL